MYKYQQNFKIADAAEQFIEPQKRTEMNGLPHTEPIQAAFGANKKILAPLF